MEDRTILYISANHQLVTFQRDASIDNSKSRKSTKLLEIELLFVDSLEKFANYPFDVEDLVLCETDQPETLISQWKVQLKECYQKVNQPCIMERRYVQLQGCNQIQSESSFVSSLKSMSVKEGTLCVVVLFTEDGDSIVSFQTAIDGRIKDYDENVMLELQQEWQNVDYPKTDALWIPPNYHGKTLKQLGSHVGLQTAPYLDLSSQLRKHKFQGLMEIHIFVAPVNPNREMQLAFKTFCSQHDGMKCCNLSLDFTQFGWTNVLMSSRYVRGNMDVIWKETFKDAQVIARGGYDVIRTKIEATASIAGVPVTDGEAQILPSKTYFEFHMVFSNPDGSTPSPETIENTKALAKKLEKEWGVCIPLSSNSFGTQTWLNMRTYGIGREHAYPRLAELGKQVEQAGLFVPRFIREFGVYDSDVTVDAGWLEPVQPFAQPIQGFLPPIQTA